MPMPLNRLQDVRSLIATGHLRLATAKCRLDVQESGLTTQDVGRLIALIPDGTPSQPRPGMASDFGDVDCDQYVLYLDASQSQWVDERQGDKVYLKFGVAVTHGDGTQCLVVSFHPALY